MTVLDWIIVCDSQGDVRLKNKSLLKFEKSIKDVGGRSKRNSRGYVGDEREEFLNSYFFRDLDRAADRELFSENRSENITRPREVPLSSKIGQLIVVVSSIIVGTYFGAIVGMLLAFSCAYFGIITTLQNRFFLSWLLLLL